MSNPEKTKTKTFCGVPDSNRPSVPVSDADQRSPLTGYRGRPNWAGYSPDPLSRSLYKPPGSGGGEVGWHQDNHYFDVEDNKTVSVWMALDDATVEDGCGNMFGISRDSNPNRWRASSGTPRRRRDSTSPSGTFVKTAPFPPWSSAAGLRYTIV